MNKSVGTIKTQYYVTDDPLKLISGISLSPIQIAYETYGKLNEKKTNVILVLHALSGSAHAAGIDSDTGKLGWWDEMIGPGKPLDTEKYFIISPNIIGSCYGSTGPASINPNRNKEYALDFPVITVRDMINVQKKLLDYLGICEIFSMIGGSLGGMQVLEWALAYPDMVKSAIVIAATLRMSTQNIAFNEIGRLAIISDPNFCNGNYYKKKKHPDQGLSIARMTGHITYLSEESMDNKFGRDLKTGKYMFNLNDLEFEVQSYLHHQGTKFVKRFDANSYLYISKAMDYFDVSSDLKELKSNTKFLIIAFTSDWLFPIPQSLEIVNSLRKNRNSVSFICINSKEGHDSFLLNFSTQSEVVTNFLKGVADG